MITTVAGLMKTWEAEFGWLRADMSSAYTLASAGAAVGGLFWGPISDRIDSRPVTIFGALVHAGGLMLLSMQSNLAAIGRCTS
jgi:MFS family permease